EAETTPVEVAAVDADATGSDAALGAEAPDGAAEDTEGAPVGDVVEAPEEVDLGIVVVESALLSPLAATGANGEGEAPNWAPLPLPKPETDESAPS
ncbi:MAG: hypothetical protein AAGE83_17490, partial [Pseudomonadota bacterium]